MNQNSSGHADVARLQKAIHDRDQALLAKDMLMAKVSSLEDDVKQFMAREEEGVRVRKEEVKRLQDLMEAQEPQTAKELKTQLRQADETIFNLRRQVQELQKQVDSSGIVPQIQSLTPK